MLKIGWDERTQCWSGWCVLFDNVCCGRKYVTIYEAVWIIISHNSIPGRTLLKLKFSVYYKIISAACSRILNVFQSVTDSLTTTPVRTPVIDEEDTESLQSFASGCSTMSCDHAYFGRNGTTFSGRSMRYVVHCSSHSGDGEEYLTPTQRASRQIRRLKVCEVTFYTS